MTMVHKYLETEMFEFSVLSQFSIALYHDKWPCDLCQGQRIQSQGHKLKAKTNAGQSQILKAND